MDVVEPGAGDPGTAERVFENSLLLGDVGLRDEEIFLTGRDLSGSARYFDARKRAKLGLLLVVFVELLRGLERLLLDAQILIEADQIPIEIEDGGDRGNDLLLELQVRDLHVVLGDANVSVVHGQTPALEQILAYIELKVTLRVGT